MSLIRNKLKIIKQDNGGIILDKSKGVYFQVNNAGLTMIEELLKDKSLEDLVLILICKYDLPPEKAENDVNEFIKSLKGLNII